MPHFDPFLPRLVDFQITCGGIKFSKTVEALIPILHMDRNGIVICAMKLYFQNLSIFVDMHTIFVLRPKFSK